MLVKLDKEFFIVAEKRLGEFVARSESKNEFKTLLSFSGDNLEGFTLQKPFLIPGELKLIKQPDLLSTFGTGIHTVTPAHNINSLRLSYAHNLSREGCVCPSKGTLINPLSLSDLKVND